MVARGRGRIMLVSSVAGFQPGPRMAVYFASKAYVTSFGEALAYELRRAGVTTACNALRDSGVINYSRGSMRILDRQKLEAAACECYRRDRTPAGTAPGTRPRGIPSRATGCRTSPPRAGRA